MGGAPAGLDLLTAADNTGVADATAAFAAARAAHPHPYVRAGTFAVTALPNLGGGFWGPGKVFVSGARFFLPPRPQQTNLFQRLRSGLAGEIAGSTPVLVVGDSIAGGAAASVRHKSWAGQLLRFANVGIAPKDEQLTTAFSSILWPYWGLSTTGVVTTGSRGPVHRSLLLSSGAAVSFAGDYPNVDAFYTQDSGVGTLAFSFNGAAAYKTVNCAGAGQSVNKLTEASGAGFDPSCYRAFNFTSGMQYTLVVVAKAAERTRLNLFTTNAGVSFDATFDLAAGTATGTGASIEVVGGGWYRCIVTQTAFSTATNNIQIRLYAATGLNPRTSDGVSGLYVSTVALSSPPSTTNLFPNSDALTTTAWNKQNISAVLANVSALELDKYSGATALGTGATAAFKFTEASGTAKDPSCYRAASFTVGTAYSLTVIAKAAERARLNLFSNAAWIADATFDLATGTAIGAGTSIEAIGNGWYRCMVTQTATAVATNIQLRVYGVTGGNPRTGDGVSGLNVASCSLALAGSATNLLANSDAFATSTWTKQDVSVSGATGPTIAITEPTGTGTYTLTAVGGPVEITGLMRLGAKTAGTPPRLLVHSVAHTGYYLNSYGAADIASMLKQAAFAGGSKPMVIIALGTNDMFQVPGASVKARALALIALLKAAGVTRLAAVLPMRHTSVWDASFAAGTSYDGAIGGLTEAYREQGVEMIPTHGADFVGEALYSDGEHPNDAGHDRMAQIIIEQLAGG